ncbi:MAG: WYL domain-containing protein [Marinilabiliaceae bacterium]|nr:WYL domain-containing protein [Marinilabiliaceae bacterium]
MPTNKNATIRYQALDRCFCNPGRKYYIDDLVKACNEALSDIDPDTSGVKKRQVYADIKFMSDSKGFDAPIETKRDGRKTYYHYSDLKFSINNQPINEQEAQQLKESLLTLSRFTGLPQFEWIEDMKVRLEHTFKLKTDAHVLSFEENPYLTGREHIGQLYDAIINQKALQVESKSFKHDHSFYYKIHPYHLKQYNNRWFLFALNEDRKEITNIPLDRITNISSLHIPYIPNTTYNFEDYFEDIIGVTIPIDQEPQKVVLKIDAKLWPYIETKPIHGSQRTKEVNTDYTIIELDLYLNYELEAQILSRGEQIEVLQPQELREKIHKRAEIIVNRYLSD